MGFKALLISLFFFKLSVSTCVFCVMVATLLVVLLDFDISPHEMWSTSILLDWCTYTLVCLYTCTLVHMCINNNTYSAHHSNIT